MLSQYSELCTAANNLCESALKLNDSHGSVKRFADLLFVGFDGMAALKAPIQSARSQTACPGDLGKIARYGL
jgi:hypothetical protein